MQNTKTTPINPLIKRKTAEERAQAIAQGLSVSPIVNNSPSYQAVAATHYPSQEEYITVTLDKLRPYEHNPRRTKNPNFEMIKESIRRRGLDHKPNITRRPGEAFYIIADGGNTRIQALKELFTETQDLKYWSISCHYKPWIGETADSVEAELNLLIGHLIENDTRADLSFIEKALGIQQAKRYYEQKIGGSLSARELANQLENDGYIIHQTLISKMERCVEYLYPFIPTVLLNGLGHTQIDKLLAIRNNALDCWQHYQFSVETNFETLWGNSLSLCNEDSPFSAKHFQDQLISHMVDTLGDDVSYESLYLEIDLDEQKFKKLAEKQHDITVKAEDSLHAHEQFQQALTNPVRQSEKPEHDSLNNTTVIPTSTELEDTTTAQTVCASPSALDKDLQHGDLIEQPSHDASLRFVVNSDDELRHMQPAVTTAHDPHNLGETFYQNFGFTPGMNIQEQRETQAKANGLSFACVGRQPVADIWQIFPARKHKAEAFSLALDIAEAFDLDKLVEHVVKTPVDYSYRMLPPEYDLSNNRQTIYDLLDMLQTDNPEHEGSTLLGSELLFDTTSEANDTVIDDITLVKIFRLIRLVRYIRQQGVHHAES